LDHFPFHRVEMPRMSLITLTINTPTPLKDFVTASVFIFDEKEKLLSKTTFDTRYEKKQTGLIRIFKR